MIDRKATAVWQGGGKRGGGWVGSQSGALTQIPYNAGKRFENEPGTNPEELIAAAHAGCFTMALAFQLENAGVTPEELRTEATVSMEKEAVGYTVKRSALNLHARVPGIERARFAELADAAKKGCPISRLLNAEVTLEWSLEGG